MGFVSFLQHVGHDFKRVFESPVTQEVEQFAATGLSFAFPAFGPLFSKTAQAVILAEQKAAALGQQSGTGKQKAADVIQILGPVIAQGLEDAGKAKDEAAVQNYINAVVLILSTVPAPAPVTLQLPPQPIN